MALGLLCPSLASASSSAGRTMVTDIPCLAQLSDFPIDSMEEKGKNNHRKRWDGFHSLISSIIPITKLGEGGSCQTGLQPHRHTRCTRVRTQHFWGSSQREQTTWQDSRCVSPWSQVGMNDILTSAASAFSSRL